MNLKKRFVLASSITALLSGLLSPEARALPNNWTGATDASWDVFGNWSLGAEPTALDDAIFGATIPGTGATITLTADELANSLQFDNAYTLTGGDLILSAPGNITVAPAFNATINTALIGTGGITKLGNGTLTLGGTNTYSGVSTFNAGTVNISAAGNLGNSAVTNTLSFGGGTLRATATVDLGVTRAIAVGVGGGTLNAANTTTLTASGALSGSGALGVTGTGIVVLSGDNSAYSGNVTVDSNNGLTTAITTLRLASNNALTSGIVTVNPSSTVAGGTGTVLEVSNATIGAGVSVVLNTNNTGGSRRAALLGSGTSVWNGTVTAMGTDIVAINAAAGANFTVNGDFVGGAGFTGVPTLRGAGTGILNGSVNFTASQLNKTDPGTWTINSPSIVYNLIQIQDGTLKLGRADVLPTNKAVVLGQASATSGTLDLNGFNQTISALSIATGSTGASKVVNLGAGTPTFTINTATDSTYGLSATNGILGGTGGNSFAVSKTGTASLFLLGNNTYTGGTTITGGKISTNNASGLGAGAVTIPSGGTLEMTAVMTMANAITLSGGTLSPNGFQLTLGAGGLNVTADSTIHTPTGPATSKLLAPANLFSSASGTTITKTGVGVVQISGAQPNLHSNWAINAGSLELQNSTAAGDGTITVNNGGDVLSSNVTIGNAITLNTGATISANGGGVLANFSGPITLAGNATAALRQFQGPTVQNSFTISGNIAGPGSLTVNSGGATNPATLTLSGTNSFVGATGITNANVLYTSPAAIAGSTANVTVNTTAAAAAGYAIDQAFLGRIVNTSVGAVALGGVNSANDLDFSAAGANFAAASLGAVGNATYTGTLTPNGTTYRLGGGAGTLTMANANAVTGANNLVIQNLGTVVLANSNDYSGTTTVSSGTLLLTGTGATGTSNVTVASGANMTIGNGGLTGSLGTGTIVVNGTLNLNRGDAGYTFAAPVTGTGSIALINNNRVSITGGNIPRLLFTNNGSISVGTVPTTIGVDGGSLIQVTGGVYGEVNAAAGGSLQITPALAGNGGDIGAIAGATLVINAPLANGAGSALDFVTAGGGTVILNGANTYTGPTAIQNAVVVASSLNKVSGGAASSSLGAPTTVADGTIKIGSGGTTSTLRYVGTGETTDRVIDLAGTTGGAILDQSGSGVLGFSSNFTATGAGIKTLTLTGYGTGTGLISGAISENTGTNKTSLTKTGPAGWALTGANTYTGLTTVANGTLTLDFANATPTTNIIAPTSPLALSAGTLALTAKPAAANTQTFASTTFSGGSNVSLTADATANPLALNLGALTRNAGSTVNFTLPTGVQSATNGVVTSTANGTGGILGGYATVGTDWATNSGNNIIPLGTYTTPVPATGGTATANYALSGGQAQTAATTFNSLKISDTAAAQTLALSTFPMTFSGAAGGLLYAGGASNAYTISGTGAGILGAGAANEFIVQVPNSASALTISAPIIGAGAGSLTKAGAGTLTLTSTSAFTGSVNITGGVLAAALPSANATTTTLGGQNGTTYRTINFTNGGTFRLTAGTFNDNAPTAAITAFVFNFGAGGGALDIASGASLTIDDGNGTGTASTNAQLQGSGDLTKLGVGTLSLGAGASNFGNFTGRIFVNAGTLTFGGTSGGVTPLGSIAAGTFVASGATINLNGANNAAAEPLTLNGTGITNGGALTNASGTAASWAGLITLASDSAIGGSNGAITLNAPVIGTGKLTKVGTGLLTLGGGNVYSGGTDVSAGILQLSRLAAMPATGTYTVAAASTLAINLGGNGEFQLSDIAPLLANTTFTNNTAAFGLNITNAPGGALTAPVITGAMGLTKIGTGTLSLPASTYTGATTIAGGTLVPLVDNAIPVGSPLVLGGFISGVPTVGTLDLTNTSQSVGNVSTALATGVLANAITIGSGRTLTVNGNFTVAPVSTAGAQTSRLNIAGGGSLVVTTPAAGLFQVGGSTTALAATLDLTGLTSVNVNTSATGTIRVNSTTTTNSAGNTGTLLLPIPVVAAGTPVTTLTAATLTIGDGGGNGAAANQINSVVLGTGLTTLNVNNVNIGTGGRDVGSLTFAAGNGSVILRGAAGGTSRAAFSVGGSGGVTGVLNGAGVTGNLADFTGHSADLFLSSLTVGNQGRVGNQNYDFKFDNGTLDATSVVIGNDTVATTLASTSGAVTLTSTVLIGGGNVTIGAGGVTMGTVSGARSGSTSAATAVTDVGNLNITGGAVSIGTTGVYSIRLGNLTTANTFVSTSDSFSVTGGTVSLAGPIITATTTRTTSTVTLDGGSLNMNNNAIGGTIPITNLDFRSGTLANASQINNGAGLTKTTNGTLILAGTNAYTGATNVNAGTLLVNGSLTGSVVNVVAGKLGGTGIIANLTTIGDDSAGIQDAFLAPGASIGTLNTAAVNLFQDAVFQLELNTSDLSTDLLSSSGVVNLGAGAALARLNVANLGSAVINSNEIFTFITASSVTGTFFGLADGAQLAVGSNLFEIDYAPNSVSLIAVPEPTTAVTLLGGLASLLGLRRFRRRSNQA